VPKIYQILRKTEIFKHFCAANLHKKAAE